MTATTIGRPTDERIARSSLLTRLLLKPELGSLIGALVVFVFFAYESNVFRTAEGISNWLDPASILGIMALPVALLMIGGEFDLSAGVMTGTAGLTTGLLTTEYNWNLFAAMAASLALCLALGFFNGYMVVRTGLPSFIITLGTFLGLQGLNLGLTKQITNTVQVGGIDAVPGYSIARHVLAAQITFAGSQFPIAIVYWILLTALAAFFLLRTRFGNWIFAIGGDTNAARNVGVPAKRTKITLFMLTAAAAWFVGNTQIIRYTSIQASSGVGQELIYIVAAVIGGCLLTGGYGSAIGASFGALIFGMTQQGIVYAGWNSDWFKFFLGAMLLLAVLANLFVRKYAEQSRR